MHEFARRWLQGQLAFWEHWPEQPPSAERYAAAEAFWDQACASWWEHVGSTLPPPLDGQVRAALAQTRLYLELARDMSADNATGPWAAGATAEKILSAALAAWPSADDGQASPDPASKRYLAAYTRYVQVLSGIAVSALTRVRDQLQDATAAWEPRRYWESVCAEVELAYRAEASGDDFARIVGELVNARIQMLSP